jgi:hypothetical protein
VAGDKKSAAYNVFLVALLTAIFTCVAFTIILASMDLEVATAFPLAYTLALSVFSAFLLKIYRMMTKDSKDPQAMERSSARQSLEKPSTQCCLILAERSHGALQDRVNYWLSGNYGIVRSSTVTTSVKGVYMTIFYEATANLDTPATDNGDRTTEVSALNGLAPLRNFQLEN